MNKDLTIIFFEDHFVCSVMPNESAWEALQVNNTTKILLYFYVDGYNIRNDEFAKERFEANDSNAFGDFYETILDRSKIFNKFDRELEPINLLKETIEEVKAVYAERIISFIPDFNINDLIQLNLCFIPGISLESEKEISNYLKKEGFVIKNKADYFESFVKMLQRKGFISSKINLSIVESYFGDLLFHYIEYNDSIIKKESEILIGKGVDYRIGNLAKLMVEKAARKSSSRILYDTLLLEQEIKKFHRKAASELMNPKIDEFDIKMELSDYSAARVIIDKRDLEKMSAESFQFIKFRYESFISKHSNLARTEKILLNGQVLSSDAFVQFFQKTFGVSKIIKPFDDFVELLSRGVFTNAPSDDTVTDEIEIKITISKKPPLPEFKKPEKPPLPEYKKPEKPQLPQSKKPPLPPSTNSDKNNLTKYIGIIGVTVSDLVPIGIVEIQENQYNAMAESGRILQGKKIKVIAVKNEILIVRENLTSPPVPPFIEKKNDPRISLN